jgi:hypothetical protein
MSLCLLLDLKDISWLSGLQNDRFLESTIDMLMVGLSRLTYLASMITVLFCTLRYAALPKYYQQSISLRSPRLSRDWFPTSTTA